jgi:hypothetical protein
MLKIFKKRIQKTKKLGFGCNKRPLNLNNNCIKNSQFCKLLSERLSLERNFDEKKIEMILIDYPHSKNTHSLKVVKF